MLKYRATASDFSRDTKNKIIIIILRKEDTILTYTNSLFYRAFTLHYKFRPRSSCRKGNIYDLYVNEPYFEKLVRRGERRLYLSALSYKSVINIGLCSSPIVVPELRICDFYCYYYFFWWWTSTTESKCYNKKCWNDCNNYYNKFFFFG